MIQIRSRVKTAAVYSQPAPADSPFTFLFIIRFFFAVFNPLDKLLSKWHNRGENRGAERLRGSIASTLKPDVGNATVGRIMDTGRQAPPGACCFFHLFWKGCVSGKHTGAPVTRERTEGERPVSGPDPSSDGKPCSGVRGDQQVSTEFSTQRGKYPPSCDLALQGENAAVFSLRTYFTKESLQ